MSRKKIKQELEKIAVQCELESRTFIAVVQLEGKSFQMYLRGNELEVAYSCGEIMKRVSRALGISASALAGIVKETLDKEEEIRSGSKDITGTVGTGQC